MWPRATSRTSQSLSIFLCEMGVELQDLQGDLFLVLPLSASKSSCLRNPVLLGHLRICISPWIHSFIHSFVHQIVQRTSYLQDTGDMMVLKKNYQSPFLTAQIIQVHLQIVTATRIPGAVYRVPAMALSTSQTSQQPCKVYLCLSRGDGGN